jgi:hypothetical protein
MAEIKSGDSADLLKVDPVSKAARSTPYSVEGLSAALQDGAQPAAVAGIVSLARNDRALLPLRADRFGSLASALHSALFSESFEGAIINPLRWAIIATTMAATQSSVAGLTFNSGAITTINTGYMTQTSTRFLKTQRAPLQAKFRARLARVNNSVMEFGFSDPATFNGVVSTGAYWQVSAAGSIQPVLTYNGVDITGADISGMIDPAKYYTFDVLVDDDEATYVVQDTSTGLVLSRQTISLPLTAARLFSTSQLPLTARLFNSGTAPASAALMILTDAYVLALDMQMNRSWAQTLASLDRSAMANPFSGASLAAWANSAEPANAALSNTAAGYTTLGGKFQFAAVAGAVTDFALFAFAVPVPANLMVTGVEIDTWNLGAAVATTPTLLTWGLGVGSTAVSLATANLARVGLGVQSLPIGSVIGAVAPRLSKQFATPLKVPAGRFLHVILRMPIATATASQVIAGMVNIEGYFE